MFIVFLCYFIFTIILIVSDHEFDELELQVVRYKPEGLDTLCRNTKFSRKELQIMYRGFKQVSKTKPIYIIKQNVDDL